MYKDFLKYIHDNNIVQINDDIIYEYLESRAGYSDEEEMNFYKECIEKRKELGLDSDSVTEILCSIEDDEYLKRCLDERREQLGVDASFVLCYIEDKSYVLNCVQNRREELELNGDDIVWIVSELEDEELKKSWILKGKEIGLNWQRQFLLVESYIKEEDFKFEFITSDKRNFPELENAKRNLIVNTNNENFIKKCVERYKELGFFSPFSLLAEIKDEDYIKEYIQKHEMHLFEKIYLVDNQIHDDEYKYNFVLNNIDNDYADHSIKKILEGIEDKEIIKKIVEEHERFDLYSREIFSLIQKTKDIDYIKDCVENWEKLGLSEYQCGELIIGINDEEYTKKCVQANKQLRISEFEITILLKSIKDTKYIKECIEKHEAYNLNSRNLCELLEYLDDEEYTKSIIMRYKELNLDVDVVFSMIFKIEDNTFIESFASMFSKTQNVGFDWQKDCKKQISDKDKVILSSPTGSGKTRVFLEWALSKQERPIYITAPIKALSNQRYRELKEMGINVGIETGDIKNVPPNCDIICCTQEIYTIKYTNIQNATCIMDEFHYIFESDDRARAYIEGLHNSQAKNILICSATFGSVEKFKEYIKKVSGEEFEVYKGDSRLTSLNYRYEIEKKNIQNALVIAFSNRACKGICEELRNIRKNEQKYSMDESKERKIRELSKKYNIKNNELLEYVKYGIAYYFGSLLPKEKSFIEELFENKIIDTVVGTDALAMGVNFPVQNVVFAQTVKYGEYGKPERISKNLFEQIAGRAGRKGYFEEGNVYFCDDFIERIEAHGYNTREVYLGLLMSDNEDVCIRIKPDVKAILKGEKTIDEENDFVNKFSTMRIDVQTEIEEIIRQKDAFKENLKLQFGDEISGEEQDESTIKVDIISNEFDSHIGDVYFNGFDPEINFTLFSILLANKAGYNYQCEEDNSISNLFKYLIKDAVDVDEVEYRFNDLMQIKAYITQLPSQYRREINIMRLENLIDGMDETVLHQGQGDLQMHEVRKGIAEQSKNISIKSLGKATADADIAKCEEASGIFQELLIQKEK